MSFADLYSHKGIEISMIVSGTGMHRVMEQTIPCKEGDIYLLNANIPHRYYASEDGAPLIVRRILFMPKPWLDEKHAEPSTLDYCYGIFSENATASYAVLTRQTFEKIQTLWDLLTVELLEKKSEWENGVRSYLSLILITFVRYVNRAIKNVKSNSSPTEWNQISLITRAVAERYGDEKLTLEQFSATFFISQSQLSRMFRRLCGETFKDYLKNYRLNVACQLLSQTNLTVENIMHRCGLKDATSFYRAFQKYTGMTPIQYRKNKQRNKNKG